MEAQLLIETAELDDFRKTCKTYSAEIVKEEPESDKFHRVHIVVNTAHTIYCLGWSMALKSLKK